MIRYQHDLHAVTAGKLAGFFEGWKNPPSPETHLRLLANSAAVVLAVAQPGGSVVGFINALSDGVLSAYIPLLEVLPDYRRQGIGAQLVREMLARLEGLYMIDLLCDPPLQTFYARLNMQPASGMMRRNYAAQSGRIDTIPL